MLKNQPRQMLHSIAFMRGFAAETYQSNTKTGYEQPNIAVKRELV